MARAAPRYQCTACGGVQAKWAGRCPECGAWNTLEETGTSSSGPRGSWTGARASEPVDLAAVPAENAARRPSGLDELDRVLGGGIVQGAVVLLGGDPGVGKSTLLLQMLAGAAGEGLYVSGEESPAQVALRARRLGLAVEGLRLLPETRVETILATLARERPRIVVIDSIQTIYSEALQSAPGSVAQVRECAAQLVRFAKTRQTTVFLVGHVTKEGALAGPRVLEHMVDTVLYFEGDPGGRHRLLRAVKNRFGAANELGVFAMLEAGLRGVSNPSAIFLSGRGRPVPGSVVTVTREGTRQLLVEIQALVDESHLGNPRRVAVGLDTNRLSMLLAVLHRHAGVPTHDQDVFLNVVGGVRIPETAADLPQLLAVWSSLRDRPLPEGLVAFGEVGLSGEVRPVPAGQERLAEARKHGFRTALVPEANRPRRTVRGLEVLGVRRLEEALSLIRER